MLQMPEGEINANYNYNLWYFPSEVIVGQSVKSSSRSTLELWLKG